MSYKHQSILVIHTAFPGDIILSIPLLKAISETLTPLRLYVLTTPAGAEILSNFEFISDIIIYDKHRSEKGFLAFLKKSAFIRQTFPDISLAIIPHKSFRSALLAYLSNIRYRVGFITPSTSFYATLYNKRVARDRKAHEIQRNLKLLLPLIDKNKAALLKKFENDYIIPWSKDDKETVLNLLPKNFSFKKSIVISPCSNWNTKAWPVENFCLLAKLLIQNNYDLILISSNSKKDLIICSQIESYVNSKKISNLSGKTSFPQLSFLFSNMTLLVTNDSAPMHIGASHNKPLISIFGATTPALGFYPFSAKSKILETNLSCRPCGPHGRKTCPQKHFNCMRNITPQMVYEEIIRLLKKEVD